MSSCFNIHWSDGCGQCFQSLLSVAVNVVTMLHKNSCLAQVYEAALCIDTDATGAASVFNDTDATGEAAVFNDTDADCTQVRQVCLAAVVFNDTDADCTQVLLVCLLTLMWTVLRCSWYV